MVGDALGESDGAGVGESEGAAVGADVVGALVGASVLSQQLRNVTPSLAGQHCMPAPSMPTIAAVMPKRSLHFSCIEQSPA